jgi:hypothetical protein
MSEELLSASDWWPVLRDLTQPRRLRPYEGDRGLKNKTAAYVQRCSRKEALSIFEGSNIYVQSSVYDNPYLSSCDRKQIAEQCAKRLSQSVELGAHIAHVGDRECYQILFDGFCSMRAGSKQAASTIPLIEAFMANTLCEAEHLTSFGTVVNEDTLKDVCSHPLADNDTFHTVLNAIRTEGPQTQAGIAYRMLPSLHCPLEAVELCENFHTHSANRNEPTGRMCASKYANLNGVEQAMFGDKILDAVFACENSILTGRHIDEIIDRFSDERLHGIAVNPNTTYAQGSKLPVRFFFQRHRPYLNSPTFSQNTLHSLITISESWEGSFADLLKTGKAVVS